MDYSKYYNLEEYLFKEITKKFQNKGHIDAFDFFCIIIWKANRAKTKIAKKLCAISNSNDLNHICIKITSEIFNITSNNNKLKNLLTKWKFRLPMASAILTVLYPDEFTVYDIRVCTILQKYHDLSYKTKVDEVIKGYFEFLEDVRKKLPEKSDLRDKDKYLWGKSFYEDLCKDIEYGFERH